MRSKEPAATPEALEARLARARSRGEVSALGREADANPEIRAALLVIARRRQVEIDPETDGRRLVRALLGRAEAAQIRSNPIRVDEAFTCACCGAEVPPGGARVRDHCPVCLRSLHVDVVPGDRAATCGALLDPVGFDLRGGEVLILYRCRGCGARWQGRAHPDDAIPAALPGQIADPIAWRPAHEGRLLRGA